MDHNNISIVELTQTTISKFHKEIFHWWEKNKRHFPWRETVDPYRILVSEFMLQQTQTKRVVPKYREFLHNYPTISSLAESKNKELLATWSGLGYNKRAIWLKIIATIIEDQGYFPTEPYEFRKFKGIGPYTCKSIPIFAFNANFAAVDVNIKRILFHYKFIKESTKEQEIQDIAQALIPENKSRDWHNALMDLASSELKGLKVSKVKTKPFKGSTREMRGKIIKLLTISDSLSLEEMKIEMKIQSNDLQIILKQLTEDGMIRTIGKQFSI